MREILLPRSFDITAVTTVASDLNQALGLGDLMVDATAVAKVDAAALQLLCAAVISARARHARVAWKGVPAVLADAAQTLALGEVLGLTPAPAPTQEDL